MNHSKHLDALVKKRLRDWPQQPPGMGARPGGLDAWLRGRPANDAQAVPHPFLKHPGSDTMRTLPDGLWLNFGGTPVEPFVDIFGIMQQAPPRKTVTAQVTGAVSRQPQFLDERLRILAQRGQQIPTLLPRC
jgi:hypothetical protein